MLNNTLAIRVMGQALYLRLGEYGVREMLERRLQKKDRENASGIRISRIEDGVIYFTCRNANGSYNAFKCFKVEAGKVGPGVMTVSIGEGRLVGVAPDVPPRPDAQRMGREYRSGEDSSATPSSDRGRSGRIFHVYGLLNKPSKDVYDLKTLLDYTMNNVPGILELYPTDEEKYKELVNICYSFNAGEFSSPAARHIILETKMSPQPIEVEPGIYDINIKKGDIVKISEDGKIELEVVDIDYCEEHRPKSIVFRVKASSEYPIIRPEFKEVDMASWQALRIHGKGRSSRTIRRFFYKEHGKNKILIGDYVIVIYPFFDKWEQRKLSGLGFVCTLRMMYPNHVYAAQNVPTGSAEDVVSKPGLEMVDVSWPARLADSIKIYTDSEKLKAQEPKKKDAQNIIVAIETEGWFPEGYRAKTASTASSISRLAERVKRHYNISGTVTVVYGNSKELLGRIMAKQLELSTPFENIAVLGSIETLRSDEFSALRKNRAVMACIDSKDMKEGILALPEMADAVLDLLSGRKTIAEVIANHADIDIRQDETAKSVGEIIYILTPKPVKFDSNEFDRNHRRQVEDIDSQA